MRHPKNPKAVTSVSWKGGPPAEAAHLKEILRHAKAAAAGAFHWVMSTIPFPLDLVLAPAAAVGAFAGVMGFAEQDALVLADMPVFAHAGEMILPRNLSESVQSMTEGGGRGGATQNIHVHMHNLDDKSVRDFIDGHQSRFTSALRK